MNCFLVERSLAGMTPSSLAALQRALRVATQRANAPGAPVRYIGSVCVPRKQTCLCLFEADDLALVHRANEMAQAPFNYIQEAMALF